MRYVTNIALAASLKGNNGQCSTILRQADKTMTFQYSIATIDKKQKLTTVQLLGMAANFLEGIQLSYIIGLNNERLTHGFFEKYSDEDKKTIDAKKRIVTLNAQIDSIENRYKVRYRPERPDFDYFIASAEEFAKNYVVNDKDDEIYIE